MKKLFFTFISLSYLLLSFSCSFTSTCELENATEDKITIITTGFPLKPNGNFINLGQSLNTYTYEMEPQTKDFLIEIENKHLTEDVVPFEAMTIVSNEDSLVMKNTQEIFDRMEELEHDIFQIKIEK